MRSWIDEIYFVGKRQSKKRFRRQIYSAWGDTCAYCGAVAESLDHVMPRHNGGLTVMENLIPACLYCNGNKGSQDFVVWYRKQKFYSIERETLIWLWIKQFECSPNDGVTHKPISCRFRPVEHSDLLLAGCDIDRPPLEDGLFNVGFLDEFHQAA
jgi:hypothetical protein